LQSNGCALFLFARHGGQSQPGAFPVCPRGPERGGRAAF